MGRTCFICCAEKAGILFVKLYTLVDDLTYGFISFPKQTQIILLALKVTKYKILAVFQVFIGYFLSASRAEILNSDGRTVSSESVVVIILWSWRMV